MRVGLDLAPLRPPLTGIGNYELHLLEALIERGDAPELVGFSRFHGAPVDRALFEQARMPAAGGNAGAPTLAARLRSVPGLRPAYAMARRAAFRRWRTQQRIDLFHAFAFVPPGSLDVPVVPVVYDLSFVRFPQMHPEGRLHVLRDLERVVRAAPVIHTISKFSASEIASVYGIPPSRIRVIYPGVLPAFLRPANDPQGALAGYALTPKTYFLAVSTLEPRKNLRTLVAAFARLSPAERQRFPLCLAGVKGWGTLDLPAGHRQLEEEGSLRFLGYVPEGHLRALYENARALLYPSIYEGFGMPIVEALACGTEVICSDAASMPEAAGEAARCIPPLDEQRWTEELRRAMEPDSAQARAERQAHAARFTWAAAAEQTVQLYAAAVGRGERA